MNTPTHAILGAVLLARGERRRFLAPAVLGATLPDVPLYVLFAVATFVWRQPQAVTWGRTYFEPGWQHAVDALHSFPLLGAALALTGLAGAGAWRSRTRVALASALLHALADLLVHHDDAHHHLWPLSDWRLLSPVSYWDPRHHGLAFAAFECAGALALLPIVWRATTRRAARAALVALGVAYVAGAGVAAARLLRDDAEDAGSLQEAVTGRA